MSFEDCSSSEKTNFALNFLQSSVSSSPPLLDRDKSLDVRFEPNEFVAPPHDVNPKRLPIDFDSINLIHYSFILIIGDVRHWN